MRPFAWETPIGKRLGGSSNPLLAKMQKVGTMQNLRRPLSFQETESIHHFQLFLSQGRLGYSEGITFRLPKIGKESVVTE